MQGKTKILTLALFAATAGAVAFYPVHQSIGAVTAGDVPSAGMNQHTTVRPKVEVVFALDTTSSMHGLIETAKEKIWSIATTMASAQNAPEIRMGLVAFRDRGDAYVTHVTDLSSDLDTMYATLMDFRAEGGGDGPESVNQALHDAVHGISWSQDLDTYKVVFLVGDAPPHMDYTDEVQYPKTMTVAQRKGIAINTIQAGSNPHTTPTWQHIAALGDGQYF
ncbi:MAG: vWA domain-containing protein, partial [Gammaproteobacteria bacterium]